MMSDRRPAHRPSSAPERARPRPRRAARAARREPRPRRRRRRARRRLRRVRRGRLPRRPRARRGDASPSATTRNARAVEVLEPSPDRVPIRCDHEGGDCPGSPWQALRYERQLEHKQRAGRRRAAPPRRPRGLRAGADRRRPTEPWRYRNKMEYSFGERDGRRATLVLGFHARGRWDRIDDARDCCSPPSATTPCATSCATGARREGLTPTTAARGAGLPAQPRRARGPAHRRPAGAARHEPRRVPRRGARRGGARRASREAASSGPAPTARRGGLARRRDRRSWPAPSGSTEELGGLRFRISPEAFFQTNTEMAERLYGLAADYAGLRRHASACSTSTAASARSASRSRCAPARCGASTSSEEAIADAIANAALNEIDNAHFFAGDVRDAIRPLAERAPRPDVVVVDPPRAGLSQEGRAPAARDAARGASSTSPATRRRSRRTRARWSTTATGSLRCAPWTCSPTPRTSSASRCSSARMR